MGKWVGRRGRVIWLALGLWLYTPAPLFGIQAHEKYQTARGRGTKFELLKRLGEGFFGEVWLVDLAGDNRRWVAKFYKDPKVGQFALQHYGALVDYFPNIGRQMPNVVPFRAPETVNRLSETTGDFEPDAEPQVVLLAPEMRGTVRMLRDDYTAQEPNARIGRLANLIDEAIAGVDQLHRFGLTHFDITPNNILVDIDGRHRLGDLDSVSATGSRPMPYAWERDYGAPEFGDSGVPGDYRYSDAGDFWSIGAVVFELLTGAPPLTHWIHNYARGENAREHLSVLRRRLALRKLDPRTFENYVDYVLNEARDRLVAQGLSKRASHLLVGVTAIVRAALTVDVATREQRLRKILPGLAIFHQERGCLYTLQMQEQLWEPLQRAVLELAP